MTFYLGVMTFFGGMCWFYKTTYASYMPPKKVNYIVDFLSSIWLGFALVLLINVYGVDQMRVPSGSMVPLINISDKIIVNKTAYDYSLPGIKIPHTEPGYGEMVVTRFPLNPNIHYVKIVVGLSGDQVAVNDKGIEVNGHMHPFRFIEVADIDHDKSGTKEKMNRYVVDFNGKDIPFIHPADRPIKPYKVTRVPDDGLYLIGTNLAYSGDSRELGAISRDYLVGAVY